MALVSIVLQRTLPRELKAMHYWMQCEVHVATPHLTAVPCLLHGVAAHLHATLIVA
jgi:hypothetical protein